MEGICDMFNEQEETTEYKLKEISFKNDKLDEPLKIYEMDGKEESVLIGEALWKGSMVMSRWMIEKD